MALEVLKREPEGAFVVRESNSRSGRLALSVRVPVDFHPSGIAHYLIIRAPKGFRIKVSSRYIVFYVRMNHIEIINREDILILIFIS